MKLSTSLAFALAAALASSAQAQDVTVAHSIGYADESEIASNIRSECTALPTQLSDFTRQYAAGKGVTVHQVDEVSSQAPGRVLLMRIDEAVSMGNAFVGHQKYSRISGELYEDGERVSGFRARRNSMGGAFGGYKGSCSVLGRTMRALGRDVGEWLADPQDGARLGNM
jgi:hypothetical protein